MFKYLTALFLLCTTFSALASEPTDHWLEVQSSHFTVLTDSNEKQARRIASQFEQMRSIFHQLMPHASTDAGSPIIVVALKDKKGFQSLEPEAYLAKNQLNLAGYFMHAADKNYILLRLDGEGQEEEHPFATVYHEYTHFMLMKNTWLPLWLNEGYAEFYQNTTIHDKEVLLGQPSSDDIFYLRQNRLIPVSTIFKVDYTSPYYHDEQKGSIFYAESWALTHYLIFNDRQKNTHRVTDYAQFLIQGEDSVTAAQHAFGDLNQLQQSLQNYVQQAAFNLFKMNSVITADVASFQARPVSTPEANAVRADVLVYNQRTKEAEALLANTLQEDPNNALAHETMGFLKFREKDIPAARKWYGEAVQLDSHSYLAYYYFASMSIQSGTEGQDEAIESSLKTAIKLNPSFAPSYDTLANFYAMHNEKLDEAHMLNVQAVQIEPENLYYRLNTASVLSQQRQYVSAINVLKAATAVAKSQSEKEMVQDRINALERFQAAQERNAAQNAAYAENSSNSPASISGASGKTIVFKRVDGKVIGVSEEMPAYPAGDSKGPQHTVKGVLRDIRCSYPTVLALTVEQPGKKITLYNNNYYKIVFTTTYDSNDEIKPCTAIEDMKASVKYAEVTDKNVAGQILEIELSK
jgi:tetratricopeptide (TPR) repeat protein